MKFKTKQVEKGFEKLHPKLKEILLDLDGFFEDASETMFITETKTTPEMDKLVGRKSKTHQQGRAVDISTTRGLDGIFIAELIRYANQRYSDFAALSKKGEKRLLVYGDKDHLDHIHLQVRP